ncbi:hypothetical protein H312_02359, partial [Anncaliia algerae PRA339]
FNAEKLSDHSFLDSLLNFQASEIDKFKSKDLFFEHKKEEIENFLKVYDFREREYITKNKIIDFPSYFPDSRLPSFDCDQIYERLNLDTLFFIFYTEVNTIYQHYTIIQLKKRSWRFHSKYLSWFQRLEEPTMMSEEYERGSYLFFDYDTTWAIRKKCDFIFEYKYLEDEKREE